MLAYSRRWTRQPGDGARISDKWAGRVSFASIGGSTRNIAAAGDDTRNFDFDTVASPAGLAVDPTTTAGRYIEAPPTGTQDFTLLSVIVPQSVTGVQQIASRDDSGGGGAIRTFQFRTNGAAVEFLKFNTAVAAFTASIASAAAIGRTLAVVGVSRGTAIRVFCNGLTGSATLTGTSQSWLSPTVSDSRWFERRSANTNNDHGSHLSALRVIIPEGISDDEARELSLNPWQLFAPRRIWVPQSAGGSGDITGNLAATESASDTGEFAGSVSVSGGAAGTETGDDSAAVTGAVSVIGSFSASESGADTAALTGFVESGENRGDIAATEAGADSGAFTGAVFVSGDLAASEDNDSAAFAGEVVGAEPEITRRRRGHASAWIKARQRLALQTWWDYLTEEEPAESTKRVIAEVKAGRPVTQTKPPKGPSSISAEKLADKIIPSRLWTAQNLIVDNVDLQRVVANAIKLAQERDDEEILMLL